jgi:carbamoyltransferase
MDDYILSFKPAIGAFGTHDPSAAIFRNCKFLFGVEEERLNRKKHAEGCFPTNAIESCLNFCDLEIQDVQKIILPYQPRLEEKILDYNIVKNLHQNDTKHKAVSNALGEFKNTVTNRLDPTNKPAQRLANEFGTSIPPIELRPHHFCHAASAFYKSGFENAVVFTIDGKGEHDSTVIWGGTTDGLERLYTYKFPNSLGHFYAIITEFLGFRAFNGEGKVMGLAPYGNVNNEIEDKLRSNIKVDSKYDVTNLTKNGINSGVEELEKMFGRERKSGTEQFTNWEKDLAHTTQYILEEIVTDIVGEYVSQTSISNVALAGGVVLNCKMNRQVMEMESVDELFIQPVAHDAGLALGAGIADNPPQKREQQSTVYFGDEYSNNEIKTLLENNKISYKIPSNLEKVIARKIANGKLVGWFQGRMEMGPRALGNRSILADPRSIESRDRVNKYVKHREEWRPFAPSILEDYAEEYLVNSEESPFMIKTFSTKPEKREEMQAVLHPADNTTRPQTVRESQNERYYDLISEFQNITGVPILLNTSFNDHGEPIVNTPAEALEDFYKMGLDCLVLEDLIVEKE